MDTYTIVNSTPCASPRAPTNSPVPLYDVNWHHMGCSVQTVPFRHPATARDYMASFPTSGNRASHTVPVHNEYVHGKYHTAQLRKSLKFAKVYPTFEHGCSLQRSARQMKTIASLFCTECRTPILAGESTNGDDKEEDIVTKTYTARIGLEAGDNVGVEYTTRTGFPAMPDIMSYKTKDTSTKIKDNRKPMNTSRVSTKVYPCVTMMSHPEPMTKEKLAEITAMFCVQGKYDSDIRMLRVNQCDDGHVCSSVRRVGVADKDATKQRKNRNTVSRRIERLRRAILGD